MRTAAEFVYGRLQDRPEDDSRHERWREVIVRRLGMEGRHLFR